MLGGLRKLAGSLLPAQRRPPGAPADSEPLPADPAAAEATAPAAAGEAGPAAAEPAPSGGPEARIESAKRRLRDSIPPPEDPE